ncbi:unnamed protein product [Medioppia subpectinata]|uniref:F-box domain-containing protein n=1 Tax=Medioppia subpectinata TaxID=1979941 RepID=A0A7R9KZM5_9ACAR|nr:unnamed protein product [Medioppia subpectinata]CAG2112406.1 unnamed protein product [Medioppia subpectinata]
MTQELTQMMASLETKDNSNEYNKQPQMYAKNSMDRFGDDLCALLLSYLSIEDRFRCEYVSKQFQRTVFENAVDITLKDTNTKIEWFLEKLNAWMRRIVTHGSDF